MRRKSAREGALRDMVEGLGLAGGTRQPLSRRCVV
jgi:hypothetical protein